MDSIYLISEIILLKKKKKYKNINLKILITLDNIFNIIYFIYTIKLDFYNRKINIRI